MKKFMTVLLTVALILGVAAWPASAEEGTCGANLTWTLDDSGTLTISGNGAMVFSSGAPWYDYSDSIYSVVIDEGVTTIAFGAFMFCKKLSNVTLPSSLVTIEGLAFSGCEALTNINIPASVTSIDAGSTFSDCDNLESIDVDDGSTSYCSVDGVLFDADNKQLICYPAKKADSSYTVPSTVEIIKEYAFDKNTFITDLTIPESVSIIDTYAFVACTNLQHVSFSEGLEEICSNAFVSCNSLKSIKLPASLVTYGDHPFESCLSIAEFEVAEGSEYLSADEAGVLYNADKTTLISFPSGSPLNSYVIPEGVQIISSSAFVSNTNLNSVICPSSLIKVEGHAFYNCDGLTDIEFQEGLNSIGFIAFDSCDSLTTVKIKGSSTSLSLGMFNEYNDNLTVYAPKDSLAEEYCSLWRINFAVLETENEPIDPFDPWTCPECGAEMDGGKFCSECGAARPGTQVCPRCGYVVPEGQTMKFCPECGTQFE